MTEPSACVEPSRPSGVGRSADPFRAAVRRLHPARTRLRTILASALLLAVAIAACRGRSGPSPLPSPTPTESAPQHPAPWTDVAPAAGITIPLTSGKPDKGFIIEAKGGGVAFLDYDLDGLQDLYVVNGSTREQVEGHSSRPTLTNHLYRNRGDWTFTDVTTEAGVGDPGWGYGCVTADYDNDGNTDIYVNNIGHNVLYHNQGDGTFVDVTAAAGVDDDRYSTGAAFGDYDGDGDLDLYIANFVVFRFADLAGKPHACRYSDWDVMCGPMGLEGYPDRLLRNNDDGTFTDVTESAGVMEKKPYLYGFTPVFEDFDDDGLLDLYVPNDSCPNYLFHNLGEGKFREEAVPAGVAFREDASVQASMGIAVGDYDQDGRMDIFLTHWYHDYNTLYHNEGRLVFTDRSYQVGLAAPSLERVSWGTFFFDWDNDGDLDLFVANGHTYPPFATESAGYRQPNMLFANRGDGHFDDVSAQMGADFLVVKVSRGAAYADVDNDGDLDIFVTDLDDPPTLLRNQLANGNHFISIRLRRAAGNRDALNARVAIRVGERTQLFSVRSGGSFLSDCDRRVFCGLGSSPTVDRIEVVWPDGAVERWQDIPGDRFIELTQGDREVRPQRLPGVRASAR